MCLVLKESQQMTFFKKRKKIKLVSLKSNYIFSKSCVCMLIIEGTCIPFKINSSDKNDRYCCIIISIFPIDTSKHLPSSISPAMSGIILVKSADSHNCWQKNSHNYWQKKNWEFASPSIKIFSRGLDSRTLSK